MELKGEQFDKKVKAGPLDYRALLFYGPDRGLVEERANAAVRSVLGEIDDPFRLVELTPAQVKDEPARLHDEASSLSFSGGQRVIRLRGLGNEAGLLRDYLTELPGDALLIAEAGEIPRKSELVKLFEKAGESAAAVACYRDEGANLGRFIDAFFQEQGQQLDQEARSYLAANLGGDRQLTRRELEKLSLYAADKRTIDLDDARTSIGDSAALSLDDLSFAVADGRLSELERTLNRSLDEGVSPVAVLRTVSRHFQRLHLTAGLLASGEDIDTAMKKLRPPVFWKVADRFKTQARTWPIGHLTRALERLMETEAACKKTGAADNLLCSDSLFAIARGAPRQRNRPRTNRRSQ
ncbi:DNA polymerase III subunit delta [Fodinicurvata fenggangensis]|uniref:DNA polymerase III subunit delta n=1 Tax=Fodinicurvata fenggangensis TaxID=1121830 RepID=UPI00047B96D1|nr:DNA polymerase III subunit delta [Fodinicurvata fenggangensis]